ncbi:MAG: alpha/beta hydrolase-fold protein [Bacteroidota bacterium]
MKSITVTACILLVVTGLFSQTGEDRNITIGERGTIYSKVLNEHRNFSVYLPPSHMDTTLTEEYPVIYVLDGDWYFHVTSGIIQYAKGAFKLPEMIVVAISNVDRIRDFTPTNTDKDMFGKVTAGLESSGGASNFTSFLQQELIPHIDSSYRTMNFRILAGHSFGGLLANHIFITNNDLFQSYIIIDPSLWWDGAKQVGQTKEFLANHPFLSSTVFFGEADYELNIENANTPHIEAMNTYKEFFNMFPLDSIRYKSVVFENETHASVGLPSIYHGLSFLFEGYRPTDPTFLSSKLLASHYEALSQKYKVNMYPPEGLVRNLGWGAHYGEKNLEKALEFFKLNTTNYPESSNAFKVLAEAYEADDQLTKAISAYKKSLELNPQNTSINEKINQLQKE